MSHTRTVCWVWMLMAAAGLVEQGGGVAGDAESVAGLHLLVGLAVSYLCFLWYCADSDARRYVRSRWLSAALIACTPGAIPYYLLRSRQDGERGPALGAYTAYLALVVLAVWVGMATQIALG